MELYTPETKKEHELAAAAARAAATARQKAIPTTTPQQRLDRLELLNQYDQLGWVIFPLMPIDWWTDPAGTPRCSCNAEATGKHCPGIGKHPRVRWTQLKEHPGPQQIERWFDLNTAAGWGVHLGPSDLFCLDEDPRNGSQAGLTSLQEKYGALPRTLTAETGGGGRHRYFQAGESRPELTSILLADGIELLSGQHITIIPPSPHKSKRRYRWIDNHEPVPPPTWMLDLAHELVEKRKAARKAAGLPAIPVNGNGQEQHRAFAPRPFTASEHEQILERARRYLAMIPPGIQGQNGSKATFRAACVLVQGFALAPADAYPLLVEYSDRCVPPWSEGELQHKLESAAEAEGPRGYLLDSQAGDRDRYARELANVPDVSFRYLKSILPARPTVIGTDGAAATDSLQPDLSDLTRAARIFADAAEERTADEAALAAVGITRSRKMCPNCCRVSQQHLREPRWQIIFVPCKKWDCQVCSKELKLQRGSSLSAHFHKAEATGESLYMIRLADAAEWTKLYRKINKAKGKHVKIKVGDGLLIVTTAAIAGAEQVNAAAASQTVRSTISALPLCTQPVATSRTWKLPQKKKRPREWKRIGKIPAGIHATVILQVLESQDIHVVEKSPHPDDWIQRIMEFRFPASWGAEQIQALHRKLCEGDTSGFGFPHPRTGNDYQGPDEWAVDEDDLKWWQAAQPGKRQGEREVIGAASAAGFRIDL